MSFSNSVGTSVVTQNLLNVFCQHHVLQTFTELFVNFLEKESDTQLMPHSRSQPPTTAPSPSGTRPFTAVTAVPAKLQDSLLQVSPLASSTPLGNSATPLRNPLAGRQLMNAIEKEDVSRRPKAIRYVVVIWML